MIARVWRGVVARDRRADYVTYVDATGVAEYRQAPGCRVSMILTRDLDGTDGGRETPRAEVIAYSVWDDEAAIRAFAGPDIDTMVLYAEDQDFLLDVPTLTHHHVHSFFVPAAGEEPGHSSSGPGWVQVT